MVANIAVCCRRPGMFTGSPACGTTSANREHEEFPVRIRHEIFLRVRVEDEYFR